jgi:hypothetical protein
MLYASKSTWRGGERPYGDMARSGLTTRNQHRRVPHRHNARREQRRARSSWLAATCLVSSWSSAPRSWRIMARLSVGLVARCRDVFPASAVDRVRHIGPCARRLLWGGRSALANYPLGHVARKLVNGARAAPVAPSTCRALESGMSGPAKLLQAVMILVLSLGISASASDTPIPRTSVFQMRPE